MMKRILYFLIMTACVACSDDDSFSASPGLRLDFSADTLRLDTVFSRTPSSTYSFWVHNHNDDGLRIERVRLKRGNQTGYRVNVDGIYLDNANGSQASGLEIRRNDSLLVFVELTAEPTRQLEPQLVEDDLLFTLESGLEQKVNLRAWAWDAVKLYSPVIVADSVIESEVPYVIYGDMEVRAGARLTLRNTTLYFHNGAGLEVYGSLEAENATLRGDRLDRMFSYLPYDRVCGQWKGVRLHESSNGNHLKNTEIRNTMQGIVCDASPLDVTQYRLLMQQCVVHNCQGDGVKATGANIRLEDCQLTNTEGDCLSIDGGQAELSFCTLAQFYPFSADRGAALRFTNASGDLKVEAEGLIVTGYADDVLTGVQAQEGHSFDYTFSRSLLRTPKIEETGHFSDIIWETPDDSVQGKGHFIRIDEENLDYDFHLDSQSPAVGLGCYR